MDIQELSLSQFPATLREIPDPPKKLWLRGSLPSPNTKLLAVVGSRALSRYGRDACEGLIAGLVGYDISIVSGLALGADACAHRAALAAGLHTIAIPGSGLEYSVIGPRSNLGLAKQILSAGGALLSENEPHHSAHPHDFPSRNRIMAGLADAVLIIEAGPQSGTLITMRLAGDYNRQLLCIPHRIGDPHGHGAEVFLRLGATLITKSEHILEALNIEPRMAGSQMPLPALSDDELLIMKLLEVPRTRDELLREIPLPIGTTLTTLVALELKALIEERFGRWQRI